jgi:endoplasmic reticulum Man9GlcNAc2 1,2-alpha-mannosidase
VGIGYTIIDTLDSLLVMGFDEEYKRAAQWVKNSLTFDVDAKFNTFEVIERLNTEVRLPYVF